MWFKDGKEKGKIYGRIRHDFDFTQRAIEGPWIERSARRARARRRLSAHGPSDDVARAGGGATD